MAPRKKRRKVNPADCLTTAELADKLGVTIRLIHALRKSGELRGVDVSLRGRSPRFRFTPEAVADFLERRSGTPTSPTANEAAGDGR